MWSIIVNHLWMWRAPLTQTLHSGNSCIRQSIISNLFISYSGFSSFFAHILAVCLPANNFPFILFSFFAAAVVVSAIEVTSHRHQVEIGAVHDPSLKYVCASILLIRFYISRSFYFFRWGISSTVNGITARISYVMQFKSSLNSSTRIIHTVRAEIGINSNTPKISRTQCLFTFWYCVEIHSGYIKVNLIIFQFYFLQQKESVFFRNKIVICTYLLILSPYLSLQVSVHNLAAQ